MSELSEILQNMLDDKNQNLLPENLKEGVTILGVEGALLDSIYYINSDLASKIIDNIVKPTQSGYGKIFTPSSSDTWQTTGSELYEAVLNNKIILAYKFDSVSNIYDNLVFINNYINSSFLIFRFVKNDLYGYVRIKLDDNKNITQVSIMPHILQDKFEIQNLITNNSPIIVSDTEPEGNNRKKYWLRYGDNVEDAIFILDNDEYKEFKQKEIINITTGQEFKTKRIIDGKIEYGKILDLGVVPNNTQQIYSTGIPLSELWRYTFIHGYTSNTWAVEMVPEKIDDTSIVLTPAGTNIKITTYTDSYSNADYKAYVELHYLKN